jgi:2-amino-4-hydroxy-6-hydroxymethyldihydropteridine diphosphokinase
MTFAYIGMGANLPSRAGAPEATLKAAAERLEALGHLTRRSSLYSTEPVGFADQPRFVNAVVELETGLEPRALLDGMFRIEQEFGRDRSAAIANGPRTLDLDILLFGDRVISEPGLEIPHPRLAERFFVLIPLVEISPSIKDARSGCSVSQLLHRLEIRTKKEGEIAQHAAIPIHWSGWSAGAGGNDAAASGTAFDRRPDSAG